MSLRIPGGVGEKSLGFATVDEAANRNLGAVFDPQFFDERAIDPIESPDKAQHARQIAQAMTAVWPEDAHQSAPGADRTRTLAPQDKRGGRQPDVEGGGGEIAVANPSLARMGRADERTKGRHVVGSPVRLPDVIETDDRNVELLPKTTRQCGFAAAGRAYNDKAHLIEPHERGIRLSAHVAVVKGDTDVTFSYHPLRGAREESQNEVV